MLAKLHRHSDKILTIDRFGRFDAMAPIEPLTGALLAERLLSLRVESAPSTPAILLVAEGGIQGVREEMDVEHPAQVLIRCDRPSVLA